MRAEARCTQVGIVRQAVDNGLEKFRPLEDGTFAGMDDTRNWLVPARNDFTISCSKGL
jgi:hypothetical protein